MQDYEFLVLSPFEFENFCRDLLQKKLGVFIESFTTGKDGGIDLRFARQKGSGNILQVKRYEQYSQLLSNLKKEKAKVTAMSPERYILCTSVGLTPMQKDELFELFQPLIQTTEDILGRNDLNNILGQHRDVELKYYKLWLSSTVVLNKILHSKVYNQSAFELQLIRDSIKLYVPNKSFNQALHLLNECHYVIISGIPGIGKTTLARMLVNYLLSLNYEEFIYLSDNIDEAYTFYEEGKSQVFLFDDFLGKIYFTGHRFQNSDEKIIRFIEKIKTSPNKVFILTTREYILQQALTAFESFAYHDVELAKCVLDLSTYTQLIKAQIIYQHLYFAQVPPEHLANLLKDRGYMHLVRHRNYNPRIIEAVINRKLWMHCKAEEFTRAFVSFFNNPESVWLYAFENSLDKFQQNCLLVLLTMGTPVLMDDLEKGLKKFLRDNNYKFQISFDSVSFGKAIGILENTFITTIKDKENIVAVEYQNPSVQDFLINYLKGKKDLIESLISSAMFVEQLYSVYTNEKDQIKYNAKKILLGPDEINLLADMLLGHFKAMGSCSIIKSHYYNDPQFHWSKHHRSVYSVLETLRKTFQGLHPAIDKVLHDSFQDNILLTSNDHMEQRAYLNLLSNLDRSRLILDEELLFKGFVQHIYYVDDLELLAEFKSIFPESFAGVISDENFRKRVRKIIERDVSEFDDVSDWESFEVQLKEVGENFNIDVESEISMLERKMKRLEECAEEDSDAEIEEPEVEELPETHESEWQIIDNLFRSLVNNSSE